MQIPVLSWVWWVECAGEGVGVGGGALHYYTNMICLKGVDSFGGWVPCFAHKLKRSSRAEDCRVDSEEKEL